jgi:hypothetical protein
LRNAHHPLFVNNAKNSLGKNESGKPRCDAELRKSVKKLGYIGRPRFLLLGLKKIEVDALDMKHQN